jgi:hypothetical protein
MSRLEKVRIPVPEPCRIPTVPSSDPGVVAEPTAAASAVPRVPVTSVIAQS